MKRGVFLFKSRRGQVWVETVIYTLIGLAIIGLVLAGALPKIDQKKDEMAIGQSIEALSIIDNKIYEVSRGVGSRRVVNLDVKKGIFVIDPETESISWILDSSFAYSEIGVTVPFGNIDVTTIEKGDYEVTLTLNYTMNLSYEGGRKQFDVAPTPHRIIIENVGINSLSGKVEIAFDEV